MHRASGEQMEKPGDDSAFLSLLVTLAHRMSGCADLLQARAKCKFSATMHDCSIKSCTVAERLQQIVQRYVASLGRRATRNRSNLLPHLAVGLHHLLQSLRHQGVIKPRHEMAPLTSTDRFLAEYRHYLEQTLGSAPATVRQHLLFAGRLINFAFKAEAIDWQSLHGETIAQFTLQQTERRSSSGKKAPGYSVRVLLRYLVGKGEIRSGLEAAAPKTREWKHASLPEHLSAAEIAQILAACNDQTDIGRRNYAILLLLSRLGLRAGEAIQLRIDDIDWVAGAITIRANKTHRERRLPLPQVVGQTLIDYLNPRVRLFEKSKRWLQIC